jgi:hypothetical protein
MLRAAGMRFVLLTLATITLLGHSGGLDANGGHNDRKAGNYHFHAGPLKGRTFSTKAEALRALGSVVAPTQTGSSNASAVLCPEISRDSDQSRTVCVKYRGEVPLASFACTSVDRSNVVKRVCYDSKNRYMVLNLTGTYYHYCEIDPKTVQDLLNAPSMGTFYNSRIKGQGSNGSFDCRTHRVPQY